MSNILSKIVRFFTGSNDGKHVQYIHESNIGKSWTVRDLEPKYITSSYPIKLVVYPSYEEEYSEERERANRHKELMERYPREYGKDYEEDLELNARINNYLNLVTRAKCFDYDKKMLHYFDLKVMNDIKEKVGQ